MTSGEAAIVLMELPAVVGGAMDSYRDDQPAGHGSRRGNVTERSDQGSLTTTQQRGPGRWNKNTTTLTKYDESRSKTIKEDKETEAARTRRRRTTKVVRKEHERVRRGE